MSSVPKCYVTTLNGPNFALRVTALTFRDFGDKSMMDFCAFVWLFKRWKLSFKAISVTICPLFLTRCGWSTVSTEPSSLLSRSQSENSRRCENKGGAWENNCSQFSYRWLSGNVSLLLWLVKSAPKACFLTSQCTYSVESYNNNNNVLSIFL